MSRYCRKPKHHVALSLLCMLAFVSACSVGPDYREPDVSRVMQDEWQAAGNAPGQFDSRRQPDTSWWRQFNDEALSGLIERLVSSSLALAEAKERIVEVNARQGVVGADRRLQLSAALGYTRLETGDEAVSLRGFPPGKTLDVYSAGVVAGWELDIWGRIGRLLEAGEEEIRAVYTDYQGLMVSLAAELTLAYVDARITQARLAKTRENIDLQRKTLELAKTRFQAGNGSSLAVVQTERLLRSTRSLVPELQRRLAVTKNRISVLLGSPPEMEALRPGPLPAVPPLIGVGLPADLLTRRPDIRRAVHRYHTAVALIGAAEAQRYPTLSLSGTFTFSSDSSGGVLDADALIYSLGPEIRVPVLTGGRIKSNVAVHVSQAEQARIALEQKIVEALAEVESGVTGVVRSQEQTAELDRAEKSALRSVALADELYRAGLDDLFQVLDNQRQLIAIQQSLLLARQQALSEVVYLYRALGGGWESIVTETAPAEPADTKTDKKNGART